MLLDLEIVHIYYWNCWFLISIMFHLLSIRSAVIDPRVGANSSQTSRYPHVTGKMSFYHFAKTIRCHWWFSLSPDKSSSVLYATLNFLDNRIFRFFHIECWRSKLTNGPSVLMHRQCENRIEKYKDAILLKQGSSAREQIFTSTRARRIELNALRRKLALSRV